jgi:hypothetical protein
MCGSNTLAAIAAPWFVNTSSALAVIMCQAGSFVPASSATMPIYDAVFTRVGASDSLTKGDHVCVYVPSFWFRCFWNCRCVLWHSSILCLDAFDSSSRHGTLGVNAALLHALRGCIHGYLQRVDVI